MASKQAMLPLLGHAVVVLSNENESPARFVVVLRVLDFLLGLEPPAPLGWQQRYEAAERAIAADDVRADAQRRAAVAALPREAKAPRWVLAKYCGWFAHPARPAQNPVASRSVRRALLTPRINPGSLYRCGREHLRAGCCPRLEEHEA